MSQRTVTFVVVRRKPLVGEAFLDLDGLRPIQIADKNFEFCEADVIVRRLDSAPSADPLVEALRESNRIAALRLRVEAMKGAVLVRGLANGREAERVPYAYDGTRLPLSADFTDILSDLDAPKERK